MGVKGAATVGGALTVVGALIGAAITATSISGPAGSDTVIDAPSGQDIVYTLNGTEVDRITQVACTATGGKANYDTCYMPSPLTTTGALVRASIQCGNVAKALYGDVGFVKTATTSSGAALTNMNDIMVGTGTTTFTGSGKTVFWNPADKLKFTTLTTPSGTLNATRYNCIMRAEVEDIYGR